MPRNYRRKSERGIAKPDEILTDTPVKTTIAQAKSSKKVRLLKNVQYNSFYKNSSPSRQKEKRNQLPLLNKNGIAWYVWTPIPIAN